MEDRPLYTLKLLLSTVSVRSLNNASCLVLAKNLDSKSLVLSEKFLPRDYRGLAEMIGFPHYVIKKMEEFEDRTLKILKAWETRPDATLDKLISYLQDMDRFDVIDELLISLKEMFDTYIEHQRSIQELDERHKDCLKYDAYVCCADEDSYIISELVQKLESPRGGLKLFIPGRDVFEGNSNSSTDDYLITTRCRRVLILLTSNFIESAALEFLVNFTSHLPDEKKEKLLIPIVWSHCEIPPVIKYFRKIEFNKLYTQAWRDMLWDSLIISLLPLAHTITMFHAAGMKDVCHKLLYSDAIHFEKVSNISTNKNKDLDASNEMKDLITSLEMNASVPSPSSTVHFQKIRETFTTECFYRFSS